MRISSEQAQLIRTQTKKLLPQAEVYLFGSRADDTKRGGDIDILILADRKLNPDERGDIVLAFWKNFGEQKIDIVSFAHDEKSAFKNVVIQEAIKL
jgi:predicted nucleotidyltransferase